MKYERDLIEFVLRGELMESKKNNIKNKIIVVVILIIILVFSSPLILNSLIIKSGINEYSNIAKEYVDEFMQGLKKNNRKAIKSGGCTFLTYIIVGILMSLIAIVFSHC